MDICIVHYTTYLSPYISWNIEIFAGCLEMVSYLISKYLASLID